MEEESGVLNDDERATRRDMTEEEWDQDVIIDIKKDLDSILTNIQVCIVEVKEIRAIVNEINFTWDRIDQRMTRLNSQLRESAGRLPCRAQQGQHY